ncbi:MAG: recombinase family protein [Phenylobacterium sp.]|uniref:recombinase family protein n=1 Tax=Phenylobacterium sp. TaxID=1871053 RepID=UPI001B41FBC5|nr:recombinase family protein [Phenylobacterium sp.]MBP7817761.1 recombinase family protein [Phenylobacterium sp.]MBP9755473.1 recombinase family protein [Phenylobacterium sp.]
MRNLVAFLGDIQAQGCDLYLHQQAIDTSTPSGRMLFQMMGVFAEFERSMITSRILAGQKRAVANGIKIGRPSIPPIRLEKVKRALEDGQSIRTIAKATGMSTATVMRVKRSMNEGAEETVAA